MKINFNQPPKTNDFPVAPPGEYIAHINSALEKMSKAGNPMIELQLTTSKAEHGEFGGVRLWSYAVITPNALWKLQEIMMACGYDPSDITGEVDFEPTDLIGSEVSVVLGVEEYQGKEKNSIIRFLPQEISSPTIPGIEEIEEIEIESPTVDSDLDELLALYDFSIADFNAAGDYENNEQGVMSFLIYQEVLTVSKAAAQLIELYDIPLNYFKGATNITRPLVEKVKKELV